MVNISLRVLSHPDVEFLPWIYANLGMDFDYRVLPSIGNEVLKAVVVRRCRAVAPHPAPAPALIRAVSQPQAQFNADQLLTQREKVSLQIRDQLTVRASDFHLTLVRPRHPLSLGPCEAAASAHPSSPLPLPLRSGRRGHHAPDLWPRVHRRH